MIGLITFLLAVLAVTYAVFFCVFKLIWVLLKKERNFWPLTLAGIGTLLMALLIGGSVWWASHKVMEPFKPLIASVQNNPELVFGERTYQDAVYPFEMTVFDGMEYSNWISISDIHLKIGIDTNVFKEKTNEDSSFLMNILVQPPPVEAADPFAPLKEGLSSAAKQRRLEIYSQEETIINGVPAYLVSGVAYTNNGLVSLWLGGYVAPTGDTYYVGILGVGPENFSDKANTMLQSVRVSTPELPVE